TLTTVAGCPLPRGALQAAVGKCPLFRRFVAAKRTSINAVDLCVHALKLSTRGTNCVSKPTGAYLGNLLRGTNWLLGNGFSRMRRGLRYHDRIRNRLRDINGFLARLISTNHAGSPRPRRRVCLTNSLRYL